MVSSVSMTSVTLHRWSDAIAPGETPGQHTFSRRVFAFAGSLLGSQPGLKFGNGLMSPMPCALGKARPPAPFRDPLSPAQCLQDAGRPGAGLACLQAPGQAWPPSLLSPQLQWNVVKAHGGLWLLNLSTLSADAYFH